MDNSLHPDSRSIGPLEIFLAFSQLALSGFGGVLPWAHRTLVEKKGWLTELKTDAACREKGKLRIEGREYVVQDGDVMHFRFNV